MAVSSRGGGGRATELQIPKKWKDRDNTSPERTRVWTEPPTSKLKSERRVPVVYYLSRNGHLDQPHFMEVPLSSPDGLFLRDVIHRLNLLRGKGMASLYSWSSKRSYKNSFVWHDLAENDFIYPSHGQEYVLKGSELLDSSINLKALEPAPSKSQASPKSSEDSDFPLVTRRRNQSWAAIDLQEYKVYKTESVGESTRLPAADASTQTDERRRRRRAALEEEEEEPREVQSQSTELSREDVSPPPSDSSPETLESLMKADGRLVLCPGGGNEDDMNRTAENFPSGRMKASSVLMQLLSCGSISFRDCGPTSAKDQGFSFVGHYKGRLPRRAVNHAGTSMEMPSFSGVKLEDKEYFSGSLIETKKEQFPALKRSSSYNADRSSQLQLAEKEVDGVRAKCIPRKAKGVALRKESNLVDKSCSSVINSSSGDQHGSKRLEIQ